MLPQTRGASLLFTRYVSPFLTEHESDIDNFMDRARERLVAISSTTFGVVVNILRSEAGEWTTAAVRHTTYPDTRP